MTIASSVYFPTIGFQAARSKSLCFDSSGNVVTASMGLGPTTYSVIPTFVSGGPSYLSYLTATVTGSVTIPYGDTWTIQEYAGVQALNPQSGLWFEEPQAPQKVYQPVAVTNGYTLDATYGLWPWGGSEFLIPGPGPYVSLFEAGSEYYAVTTSSVITSGTYLNLLLYPEGFPFSLSGTSGWYSTYVTLTPSYVTTPAGNLDATYIQCSDVDQGQGVAQYGIPIEPNTIYALSVYAMASGSQYLQVFFDNGQADGITATYDLVSGLVQSAYYAEALVTSATITSAGSGWWKCELSGELTATTDTTGRVSFEFAANMDNAWYPAVTGSTTSGLILYSPLLQPVQSEVSGLSGIFNSASSGYTPWLLGPNAAYQLDITSSGVSMLASSVVPFTATCMATGTSGLVVAGMEPFNLGSGSYAVQTGVSGTAMISFPGSGLAQTWTLIGGETPYWNPLLLNSGLPMYSSGISVAWTPVGNQIVMSDYASGTWNVFTYTGGQVMLLSSGLISGTTSGCAIDTSSMFAAIPNPASSGVSILMASGAYWEYPGVMAVGQMPECAAVLGVGSGQFAAGYSGAAALLTASSGYAWAMSDIVETGTTAQVAAYDSTFNNCYWVGPGGNMAVTQWGPASYGLVASGKWTEISGTPVGAVAERQQVAVFTENFYTVAGQYSSGNGYSPAYAPITTGAVSGVVSVGNFAADFSFPVATSGSIGFQQFVAPYTIYPIQQGVYGTIASGGATIADITVLGQGVIPSSLGLGVSGDLLMGTTMGGIGYINNAREGLSYILVSGGVTDMVTSGSTLWLSNTVQGSLVAVSGL